MAGGFVQERLKQDFTKEQHRQVADFYFNHYRTHFMSKPSLADALASIPQVPQVPHAVEIFTCMTYDISCGDCHAGVLEV